MYVAAGGRVTQPDAARRQIRTAGISLKMKHDTFRVTGVFRAQNMDEYVYIKQETGKTFFISIFSKERFADAKKDPIIIRVTCHEKSGSLAFLLYSRPNVTSGK